MIPMITFKINVPVKTKKRERWTVASCIPLDIHSQGKDAKEAIENLKEAVTLFVDSCLERGTLASALRERVRR